MSATRERYDSLVKLNLKLDLTRGQPADDNFDLANGLLHVLDEATLVSSSGVALRNYPGGVYGLREARELFGTVLGVRPEETLVGNNSSLQLQGRVLTWALLRGLVDSDRPWVGTNPQIIVTVPGYDRHFTMLEGLGFRMRTVAMTSEGPDLDAIESLAAEDPSVKGLLFVPTYSNPTGDTLSPAGARRLAAMKTAAKDFTILADDAYVVHHLVEDPPETLNLVRACEEAGNPNRAIVFGSTSKITFSGAGLGFLGTSPKQLDYLASLFGTQTIGPNKIEQYRHVLFLQQVDGGIPGLMRQHAGLLKPKFTAVSEVLGAELGGSGLARWTNPKGGYFVSVDTAKPVAAEVVRLAKAAGVALTPAGATFPYGKDPGNRNIRLSPTRPSLQDLRQAMEVFAVCVQLASE